MLIPVADPETEKFEEATEDKGLADSRRSSPIRGVRQAMQKEFAGVRMDSDRNASAGIGQSFDPVSVQKPSRGNPFGISAQARPDPSVLVTQSYPPFPWQVEVEKVYKGNLASWKVRIKTAAI